MSNNLTSRTIDDATLTYAERQAERSRQRALRFDAAAKPHAAKVIARVRHAKSIAPPTFNRFFKSPDAINFKNKIPVAQRIRTAPVKHLARRAFVRVRYAPAKTRGHWRAHGLYLEREGAQREGGRGKGFSAHEDAVSLSRTAAAWQEAGDDKIFKLILSPEDGDRLDLKDWTRRTMARVEEQIGKPIEWAAIDHHNTDNPHVHLLLRGGGLLIPKELMVRGIRDLAGDEATRDLGYRTPADLSKPRDREIEQRRYTSLDKEIAKQILPDPANPGSWLVTEPPPPGDARHDSPDKRDARRQRLARLAALEKIGVAEKVGHMTWRLDGGWDKVLKELEILQTRSTMLMQHRELLSDPRALPVVTKLQPGQQLTGRVLGTGLNDGRDAAYLLLEGTDGRAHFVAQIKSIENARADHKLQPGTLATLSAKEISNGRTYVAVADHGVEIPARGYTKVEIPAAVLDADLKHRATNGVGLPDPPATVGFAAHYQRSLIARDMERQKQKGVQRKPDRTGPEIF